MVRPDGIVRPGTWLAAIVALTAVRLLVAALAPLAPDETYYWIGKRKVTAAKGMGEKMTKFLEQQGVPKTKAGLDSFF